MLDDEALGGGFLRGGHEFRAFEEIVAHRLLHIHVLAMLQRGERDQDVAVIRRGDGDGVDFLVRAALAEVAVGAWLDVVLREVGHLFVDDGLIRIAKRDEAHAGLGEQLFDVTTATASEPDDGDADVAIRTERRGPGGQGSSGKGSGEKAAACVHGALITRSCGSNCPIRCVFRAA